jgi:hypothetical protein
MINAKTTRRKRIDNKLLDQQFAPISDSCGGHLQPGNSTILTISEVMFLDDELVSGGGKKAELSEKWGMKQLNGDWRLNIYLLGFDRIVDER